MKAVFILLALTLLFSYSFTLAQAKGTAEEKASYLTEVLMKDDLSLNDEQTTKVKAVNLEMYKKIAKAEASRESLRTIRGHTVERNEALKEILSEDQFAKFESNQRDYHIKMEEKFGG